MANIKQVAARAGLSVSCVSKYLKDADSVLPASREKIEAAIRELQYVPSNAARSLRTKRTFTVKAVMDSITNPFFAEMFEALRRALDAKGYTTILHPLDKPFSPGDFDGVDGVAACFFENESRLADLKQAAGAIPVVCIHWQRPTLSLPCVWTDVREGMRLAAAHLLEAGCRRIAYVGGPASDAISVAKIGGARSVLDSRSALLPAGIYHGSFSFQTGYDAAGCIAAHTPVPDGVLCENDVLAAGVICGLYRRGLSVPRDLRVIGFDDIPLADMYIPAMTSVSMPTTDMCTQAAHLLTELMEKRHAQGQFFPPALRLRQS